MVHIETLVVSLFDSNCFVIRHEDQDKALVVDPGDDAPQIIEYLRTNGLTVAAHLITHGHVDHVSALADLVAAFPAPVAMHPADARWAFTERAAFPPYYDAPRAPPRIERELAEGQEWTDIGLTYRIIETPGHSPGGVAFYFPAEKMLFGGDTLFRGAIGRSDLPGARPADLAASLKRLLTLPDDVTVYCGHGPETTIGAERRHNPFLQSFDWA
ncbi:MAG TPA: MBL fold metallo-hydrolase [Kiritimatiellia bacterium]|nr:MBL fold metallo-hydrolase [Kiritimatiellia bacterium]HMO97712.1 MBL fold metallo-hydrolase [Kiritimatiellia bacterium]HMP97086.1 MBL fold metallo-hydrolase [Kiritimatiellia bacterium]